MKRSAFTLIELLVVIAIIAILAAILFPVFAQAKVAAKKSVDLSGAKQVALAFVMYAGDNDDMSVTISKAPIVGLDGMTTYTNVKGKSRTTSQTWYSALQPYAKSWAVFHSSTRSDSFTFDPTTGVTSSDPFSCSDNLNPTGRCLGFGYNDGWVSDAGYGMLDSQTPDLTVDASGNTSVRRGRSLSGIASPADMVSFGSSNDNPGYSVAMDNVLSRYNDGISSKAIRFGGQFQFGFADGHAKVIQMDSAEYAGGGFGLIARPRNQNDAIKWCYTPDITPSNWKTNSGGTPSLPGDYPLTSDTETCSQAIADIYANSTVNP